MSSGELRKDYLSGEWVLYAPSRASRPNDFKKDKFSLNLPEYKASCPFCPGNESQLPPIISSMPEENSDWLCRVVPNKFPAINQEISPDLQHHDFYQRFGAYGRHEVIIESPLHNLQLSEMSDSQILTVIDAYIKRYHQIMKDKKIVHIQIFRNHGASAGTSLEHPHSQIIASGFLSEKLRKKESVLEEYYKKNEKCLICQLYNFESKSNLRVIKKNKYFMAHVPYAAQSPFEIMLIPLKHCQEFAKISSEEKLALAEILREILSVLKEKLNDPDYNYFINSASRYSLDSPYYHWYLIIKPRLTVSAGYEIASGVNINPDLPEEDAGYLNN